LWALLAKARKNNGQFEHSHFGHLILSFDFAQDGKPVEPFWILIPVLSRVEGLSALAIFTAAGRITPKDGRQKTKGIKE
jgi:hypothetical protein